MADDELKQFLRDQARSLDSLLELTSAKTMFGEDVSDQWQRKKQTPEQKKAARMAKLDPANWKSAKDVYDERSAEAAKKRKRDGNDGSSTPAINQTAQETVDTPQASKKQKKNDSTPKPVIVGKVGDLDTPDQIENKNLKKKMKKRANRLEKHQEARTRKEQRKADKVAQRDTLTDTVAVEAPKKQKKTTPKDQPRHVDPIPAKVKNGKSSSSKRLAGEHQDTIAVQDASGAAVENADEINGHQSADEEDAWSDIDEKMGGFDKLNSIQDDQDEVMEDVSSTTTSLEDVPDILSPPQDSAASSVSSILPPVTADAKNPADENKKTVKPSQPSDTSTQAIQSEAERSAARQRLQDQISQFRTQRKADDKPVRSRADLLEQRRRTEAEQKAKKKEQRKKQREEEAKLQDEEMARRFSPGGSGSLLASPRSPIVDLGTNESYTFGRIAFEDGTQLDPKTLSAVANKKQKGASDPASALKAAQAKSARIAGLDDGKKQEIEEKDMWLNAKKKAHGERVRDDTSLLKKALKRQEKQKQRSEQDWVKRGDGVRMSQEAKQKKRTDNLQKRKDEKGSKKSGKSGKKVKRPGFEGSFKGRTGKGKSK